MKPGIYYDVPAAEYHADCADGVSFSASIGNTLITQSPYHAMLEHPKLNKAPRVRDYSKEAAFGTVAHSVLLGKDADTIAVLDFADFRTNAAKDARDTFVAAGVTPILKADMTRAVEMVAASTAQLDKIADVRSLATREGKAEVTVIWERDGLPMRCRIDWLPDDHATVIDYKTTTESANPSLVARRLHGTGADLSAAHYVDGLAYHGIHINTMHFVVQEAEPPYMLSSVAFDGEAMEYARKKLARARSLWAMCLRANKWPGYPTRTCWIGVPGWAKYREDEQLVGDDWIRQAYVDFQKP